MERKLAAIVSMDVVGYSRLMGVDEAGTLARMKAHRAELWDPAIQAHGGRVVGTAGDSLLVEFASAVAAVESAIAVQEGLAEREMAVPDDRKMRLRVGINIGEVIVDGEELYGDGVNVAARVQTLAEPGGISISAKVYDEVAGKLSAWFDDQGEHTVKNIARPVRVWRWTGDSTRPGHPESPVGGDELSLPDKPSIAVLPFGNMSGDPEQEYFSDGITEDIITALSRLRWLFVIARNSTFAYKGRAVDIKRVGRELGVRYVLEGSVRKAGRRVRVTAQLNDSLTGSHIWAERYDRELADIFDLQDELTEAICAVVNTELAGSERDRARKKSPADLDAWDYYQRGMWHLYKMSKKEVAEARRLFEIATDRAPSFPSPHAALGYVAAIAALSGYAEDRDATLKAGLLDAERAVKLDERDGFNQFALGRVCIVLGEQDRAILALEKSIELNPNSAPAYYGLGVAHYWVGHSESAAPLLDRAIRLSPTDPQLWTFHYIRGNARYFMGDVESAIADQKAAIQNKGDEYLPYLSLAFVCALQGDRDAEARAAFDNARRLKPGLSEAFLRETIGNLHPPYLENLFHGLKKLGLPDE
jgi:TolB-like protein/Flp pilus assembly protein TadD